MTKKFASRGCLTGEGRTVKEAKDELNALVDTALADSYTPVLLSYQGHHALAYRCPVGWSYTLLRLAGDGKSEVGCTVFVGARYDCIQSAAFHIIQNGCNINAIRSVDDLPSFLENNSLRSELVYWCRWQRAALCAQMTGQADVHKWACEHASDPDFA